MALKCDNCTKGIMYGHNVSHSKRRTNRTFKPNIQKKTIVINGRQMHLKLCTNCIKLLRKKMLDAKKAEIKAQETVPSSI